MWSPAMILILSSVARVTAETDAADVVDSFSHNRHTFDNMVKETATEWIVVFCDDSVQSCKHMVKSFRNLATVWVNTQAFAGVQYGEVNCGQEESFCGREGAASFPMAVHYRNGKRLASWRPEDSSNSMVWQFVAWVKNSLAPPTQAMISEGHHEDVAPTLPFSVLSPFASMDRETAVVGWCLVLGVIAIVAWVILDGFELWPAVLGKSTDTLYPGA